MPRSALAFSAPDALAAREGVLANTVSCFSLRPLDPMLPAVAAWQCGGGGGGGGRFSRVGGGGGAGAVLGAATAPAAADAAAAAKSNSRVAVFFIKVS